MFGAINHIVPFLTDLDYCSHRCVFALKSHPFLGTQWVLLGQAQETSRLHHKGFLGVPRAGVVLETSHISWRSTGGPQRQYALELKCLAAAESLCGLVIRGKL